MFFKPATHVSVRAFGGTTVIFLALITTTSHVRAQMLLDLRIEGPPAVLENGSADYAAIAEFDDGNEYEVTLLSDWSVVPDDYASITQFGHLTTDEVSENQDIVVHAVFTWEDVTEEASLEVTIVDVTEDEGGDPWPEYQRTASRLGRTSTIGPRTPRVEWSISFSDFPGNLIGSPIMDAFGRIFVPHAAGMTCVDSQLREVLWEFNPPGASPVSSPATYNGRVLLGVYEQFYCLDAATGKEIWSVPTTAFSRGPVVDDSLPGGVVYFATDSYDIFARLIEDGSEVWTVPGTPEMYTPPSLDPLFRLFVGGSLGVTNAYATQDGAELWSAPYGGPFGVRAVENGRVYASGQQQALRCLDASTGEVIWTYNDGLGTNAGTIAIGHDGTVFVADIDPGQLHAVTADGQGLWQYPLGVSVAPPIVAGDGTIYAIECCTGGGDNVHAIKPDGTALWVAELPGDLSEAPMLAPDGTLYVMCEDNFLYAFQDPAKGDVSLNDIIDGRDVRFFVRVLFGVDGNEFRIFAADMNSDGIVDVNDVPLFVDTLLTVEN